MTVTYLLATPTICVMTSRAIVCSVNALNAHWPNSVLNWFELGLIFVTGLQTLCLSLRKLLEGGFDVADPPSLLCNPIHSSSPMGLL